MVQSWQRESYSLVFQQLQVAGAEHIKEGRVDTLPQTSLTAQPAPVNSLEINNVLNFTLHCAGKQKHNS